MTGAVLAAACLLSGCAAQGPQAKLDPKNPVTVTVWHYYNGAQLSAFSQLVTEFNETEGREKGIVVEQSSQGTVSELEQSVLDAANKKVGASEVPNIFAAYADTAYAVDGLGLVADVRPYLTDEEYASYIGSYLDEGDFAGDGSLKIFPIAKSVELFMLNATDWEQFSSETGASEAELATFEGVARTAQQYYEWTDARTPGVPDDGKAFFGRDAFANYMLIGARQLGVELLSVGKDGKPALNFDRAAVRRLWDNYYVPFVKGYFGANGRFRSDDVKTGDVIAYVGSSSGATFFPDARIVSDTESYPIELQVLACPQFEGGQPYAVQQGAGLVVTNGTPQQMTASVEFLKWFTQADRNFAFSLASGYLPVKKEANEAAFAEKQMDAAGMDDGMRTILTTALDIASTQNLYTPRAFSGGTKARNILEYAMPDKAAEDRAAVLALLSSGVPYGEAVAQFCNDDAFELWYADTLAALEACVNG